VPNRASTEQVPTASTSADAVKPIHTPVSPSRTVQRAPQSTQATPNEKRRLLFEQAAVLEASDPQRALEIYQSLTTERGDWAANALYAMGRLEEERGNRVRALRLLQRYIEQYPYGANTADARLLIARMISRSVPQAGREGQP
jgi:tetratricopeptide (TPR) repeat protein